MALVLFLHMDVVQTGLIRIEKFIVKSILDQGLPELSRNKDAIRLPRNVTPLLIKEGVNNTFFCFSTKSNLLVPRSRLLQPPSGVSAFIL